MSKQSRSSGTRKPSRDDLLKELESIHQTLAEDLSSDTETALQDNHDGITHDSMPASLSEQSPNEHSPMHEEKSALESTELEGAKLESAAQKVPQAPDPAATIPALPGQQSLFTDPNAAAEKVAEKNAQKAAVLENPFLPAHIKERLEREKSLYQQEIDAAVKIPGLNPYAERAPTKDAIIEELVKMYLPQIEEELRRRLKLNLDPSDD